MGTEGPYLTLIDLLMRRDEVLELDTFVGLVFGCVCGVSCDAFIFDVA